MIAYKFISLTIILAIASVVLELKLSCVPISYFAIRQF